VHIMSDVDVSKNSWVDIDRIDIDGSIRVTNAGHISGHVYICPGCQVMVHNTGQIQASVVMGAGASVMQVVDTPDSLTDLHVSAGLTLRVVGDEKLNLRDILSIGATADEIILDNTSITWNGRPRGVIPPIDLVGEVTVHINPAAAHDGDVILGNVRGNGAVFVAMPDLDNLFTAAAHRTGDNIYLQIRRETDYLKILDARRGGFINTLRVYDPNDKLVRAMDAAQTRDELDRIMARSVRCNPMRLMDGIHLFQEFNLIQGPTSDTDLGARSDQIAVFNDDMWLSAVRSYAAYGRRAFGIALGGSVGMLGHADGLNDFTGNLYGVDARVHGAGRYIWGQMTAGMTWADFDVGPVLGKYGVDENPRGRSLYGAMDVGTTISFTDAIGVLPFVGWTARRTVLLSDVDADRAPRLGMHGTAAWGMDGIDYQMTGHVITDATDALTLGMDLNIRSVMDGVSVGGGVAMRRDPDVTSFQGRLNLRYFF
ncbi:hypothetical protein HDR63_03030, partial [bacterium]|nr:hypothetical protein [bacterium]